MQTQQTLPLPWLCPNTAFLLTLLLRLLTFPASRCWEALPFRLVGSPLSSVYTHLSLGGSPRLEFFNPNINVFPLELISTL